MRIVLISIYREGGETGVAKVSELLADTLSKNNSVLYLCLGEKYEIQNKKKNLTYLTIPSIPVKQGFIPKLSNEITNKIYDDLEKFKPDIIHAHNIVFTALIGLLWAQRKNIPYVLTLHSQPTEGIKYILPQKGKSSIFSTIDYSPTDNYVKRFLEKTDCVISLNSSITKSVRKLSSIVPLETINNGIQLQDYYKTKATPLKDVINCLYLGMYMPRKNQAFLVEAFSHLSDKYHLYLHGNKKTGEEYVSKLTQLITTKNISNVTIGDFLTRQEVIKKLANTHLTVSASLKEVQSLVIIESLASGTPVFGLSNETLDEVIDKNNGEVLPQDTSAKTFANKLERFMKSNGRNYARLSNKSRESAQRFDINTVTKRHEKLYKEVIQNKKNNPEKDNNGVELLVPEQLRDFIAPILTFTKKRNPFWISFYTGLTIVAATIAWPIARLVHYFKRK